MKTFSLDVLTPEHRFFKGDVRAVTVEGTDGQLTIYPDHMPLIAGLAIGQMSILNEDGQWRHAFTSEGFIEVRHNVVLVFVQACEWPEEIDINRAKAAAERAGRKLRERRSRLAYRHSQISMARAMARLRTSSQHDIDWDKKV
jgi:F-type H+-transporting ATPase subunit epsilon